MGFGERFQSSWRLVQQTWSVMRDHKKLMLFPLLVTFFTLAMIPFILAPVALQPTGHRYNEPAHWKAVSQSVFTESSIKAVKEASSSSSRAARDQLRFTPQAMGYVAVVYFLAMFMATFFNVAFYREIMNALQGQPVSIREGLRFAFGRLPAIFLWSLFAGLVGWLIKSLEERVGLVGKLILRLVGLAWSAASVFVIPVLVMDEEAGSNPVAVLRRSAETLRKAWGEAVIGFLGIQFGGVIVLLASIVLLGVSGYLSATLRTPWVFGGTFVFWLLGLFSFVYLMSVGNQIYRCALYLYASTGQIAGPFEKDSLDLAWKIKKA